MHYTGQSIDPLYITLDHMKSVWNPQHIVVSPWIQPVMYMHASSRSLIHTELLKSTCTISRDEIYSVYCLKRSVYSTLLALLGELV